MNLAKEDKWYEYIKIKYQYFTIAWNKHMIWHVYNKSLQGQGYLHVSSYPGKLQYDVLILSVFA